MFDAIHLGHKRIILHLVNSGFLPVIFSFNFSNEIPKSKGDFFYLIDPKTNFELMGKLGVKLVISPYFEDIKNLSFVDFFKEILINKLNAKLIVCGDNFRFGRNQTGDVLSLKRLAKRYGVIVKSIDLLKFKNECISSTKARKALLDCNFKLLKKVLGYDFYIKFKAIKIDNSREFSIIYGRLLKKNIRLKSGEYFVIVSLLGSKYLAVLKINDFKQYKMFKVKIRCYIEKNKIRNKMLKIFFIKILN